MNGQKRVKLRGLMNVKLFFVTVMAALLSMNITACDPSKPSDEIDNNAPPLDEWWKEIESGGEIYADFRYKIEDGSVRIIRYEGEGGRVSIPAEIEEMTVTTIGIYAFRETKLTDVIIPDSVTTIGKGAFFGNQLASVVIPDSVTSIGEYAFQMNQLASVVIPDSVTSIEMTAFAHNELASVVIPDSVTSIGMAAFGSNRLTSVVIPDNVTSIGSGAFGSNQLTSVVIPNSVTSIGKSAFASNRLTSITISDNVTIIASNTFSFNDLARVVIPNSVDSIEDYAFTANHSLVEITIGKNVSLGYWAFGIVSIPTGHIEIGFAETYNNNGRLAGTYTRPDATSNVWTMQQ